MPRNSRCARIMPAPDGVLPGLFTANTMAILTETLGMSLPRCGTALAVSALKRRIAFASGEKIVELVRKDITPAPDSDPCGIRKCHSC